MEIIDNRGAPPELVRVVVEEAKDHPLVNCIVFDAFIVDLNKAMGAFEPATGIIYLDMGACLLNNSWTKNGFMYIANVWFNLLMTMYHEFTHASQLQIEPELRDTWPLPERYEDEATVVAGQALLQWTSEAKALPTLNELNWVGDQIKRFFNHIYAQMPEMVNEELSLEGTDIVAAAIDRARTSKGYSSDEDTARLLKQIDEGWVGKKVGDKQYLTAYEAVEM